MPCDARCAAADFFERATDEQPLTTLPCARTGCDAPAAVGCLHCRWANPNLTLILTLTLTLAITRTRTRTPTLTSTPTPTPAPSLARTLTPTLTLTRKHGGAGARQLVARCAAELQRGRGAVTGAPGGPRRIVFAAASAEVREAYRKALLALGSAPWKQQSGAVSGLCPAYGVR